MRRSTAIAINPAFVHLKATDGVLIALAEPVGGAI